MTSSVLASRLRANLITGPPAESVEAVAERLLAVQAQDLRGSRLAVRIRSRGLATADFDAALSDGRSVIVAWLNRGTLHLVPSADFWWLRSLTAPRLLTANRRRLAQEGVSAEDAERGVAVIAEEVSAGPRSRAELKAALDETGIRTVGQALAHVIVAASIVTPLIRGPLRAGQHCFVDARDWLGTQPEELERDEALRLLAVRYLAGHGPAGGADLAKWSGLGLLEARRGLAAAGDQVSRINEDLYDLAGREPSTVLPPPSLAGPFDPLLHGWSSSTEIVAGHTGIVTANGLFRPFALIDGRVGATWGLADGRITIHPLQPLSSSDRKSLTTEAAAVLKYLGLPAAPASFDPTTRRRPRSDGVTRRTG
jgi:hypothetical protein